MTDRRAPTTKAGQALDARVLAHTTYCKIAFDKQGGCSCGYSDLIVQAEREALPTRDELAAALRETGALQNWFAGSDEAADAILAALRAARQDREVK
jgi:hypothetical protein